MIDNLKKEIELFASSKKKNTQKFEKELDNALEKIAEELISNESRIEG